MAVTDEERAIVSKMHNLLLQAEEQTKVISAVCQAALDQRDSARIRGRNEERERIVKWLRDMEAKLSEREADYDDADHVHDLAEAIVRGEHLAVDPARADKSE
jgi:hypothetical protein